MPAVVDRYQNPGRNRLQPSRSFSDIECSKIAIGSTVKCSAVDRFPERLARLKIGSFLLRDVDFFAGARIAAITGILLLDDERSETYQRDLFPPVQSIFNGSEKSFNCNGRLLT